MEPIKSRYSKDSRAWFQLIENFHYLKSAKLCGAQIRYIVKSEKYGYIGALGFSSATYKLRARDAYIGWSEKARRENIQYVISNDRFLIVPTVKVKNLASFLLSKALQRIGTDWESRYGYRPVLVESYVDSSVFQRHRLPGFQLALCRKYQRSS
nr:Druantia anti-phage system protein DruA [Caldithrix abyssi]